MSVQVPDDEGPEVSELRQLVSTMTPEALNDAATRLNDRARDLRQKARALEDLATRATALATAIQGVPTP